MKFTIISFRCVASCVAVTTAISLMLQQKHVKRRGQIDVNEVIDESYRYASGCLLGRPVQEVSYSSIFAKQR